MSIRSVHPVSAEQIYAALVALGAEPVLDPDVWPEGPQAEDRQRLLGALLAKTELEITASTGMGGHPLQDVAEALLGWTEQAGPDSQVSSVVLANRLQLTAVQLMGPEREGPPHRAASWAAVVAATDALSAQLYFERSDIRATRRALDRTEASVIAILEGLHDLRVAIGDIEE
ncbi:hypothetical protein OHA79_40780 [Streptomyces sp. NBC_00841]|uniref:hypothetical protein n=1 Tax=unclassified Streptomyces TaxID=2593676 RepID=UPI00224EE299|nr:MULTISPECIES: hypothetical protein [unclassified Streptomyces]MCX4530652.1 hypothetical protein [Streptomyces sp. NBC_01669]WSA03597.1 hypothetical protein OHA79_40780 [Streptomyces sp. NBC_00841]